MATRGPYPSSRRWRGIAPGLALLMVFGLVRPARGEPLPEAAPVVAQPSRTLAQASVPYPTSPNPAGACLNYVYPSEPTPVYSHWTFWVTVGVVAVAGVVTGILLERRNHGLDMPTTTFGDKQF